MSVAPSTSVRKQDALRLTQLAEDSERDVLLRISGGSQ